MTQEVKLRRVQCNYQQENARFLLECDFSKQYDQYYRRRLERTRPYLEFNCRSKWDPTIPICNLAEVATFSARPLRSHDDSDLGSSTPSLSSPEDTSGNYPFVKRSRNLSSHETSPDVASSGSRQPRSSTQQQHESSPPTLEEQFLTPIFGPNAMQVIATLSPSIRRPLKSRTAECIVIGTIFKRMKLQPDVVEELSKGNFYIKCEKYTGHYTSQDDTLVLEDTEESIHLVGNINPKQFVTGIVVALLGVSIDDGSQFLVYDVCFAEPNRQILYEESLATDASLNSNHQRWMIQTTLDHPPLKVDDPRPIYLMIVSGLGFHHEMGKKSTLTRALQDMIDFIWGGGKFADDEKSSRVARILVVGDNLQADRFACQEEEDPMLTDKDALVSRMKQSRQVKPYAESLQATKHMDDFFAQLSKTIDVDVMPGASDPSSHLMPQQPFHPCMFPKSCMFSTFTCTTNPYHAIYNDNVEVLATSGQNVDIISKFSGLTDPIEIMKCHLLWGNSAPSAPDNLYSVPYEDDDPYVIDFIPDIYIAGCQKSYQTDYYHYTSNEPVDHQVEHQVEQQQQQQRDSFQSSIYAAETPNLTSVTPDSARASTGSTRLPYADGCSTPTTSETRRRRPRVRDNEFILPDETPKVAGRPGEQQQQEEEEEEEEEEQQQQPMITNEDEQLRSPSRLRKNRTLLVTVPEFCETFTCVLIDLKSLQSQTLSFK